MSDRDRNAASARLVFAVWSTGDVERLDAVVAAHVVHHDPYDSHAAGGLAGMKRAILAARLAHPDLQIAVDDQVAGDDEVATRWTATMTHEGRCVTLKGITIDRFAAGVIVEAWRSMDMLGFLRQTGAMSDRGETTRSRA